MFRSPEVPPLPGNAINLKVGQTHFPKPHFLETMKEGVTYLLPKELPNKQPSVYAQGDVKSPPWLVYNKKVLTFDAFYKERIREQLGCDHVLHKCKIYFFLEDGTIKVVEPKVNNSGIPQGCLIKRQRIRYPSDEKSDDFYEILDFNIGREVEFYGKIFKITSCDAFTRSFLNKLGIPVPEPLPTPEDPYIALREQGHKKDKTHHGSSKGKHFLQYMALEGKILTFDGYWDERDKEGGYLHIVKVYYYLCDDTIEMKDVTESSRPVPLVKRCKLPKKSVGIPMYGNNTEDTILNVMGAALEKSWSIRDPLNLGRNDTEYFKDCDLLIGATINAYGRRIILTCCDDFTKDYYKVKYGLDDFTPLKRPLTKEESDTACVPVKLELPPYNGFGSHEDSAINCRTVNPFSAVKSYKQFFEKDKEGYDSKIFRFSAVLLSDQPLDQARTFVVSYYLVDDTVSVFENAQRNSGFNGGTMIGRRQIMKPGECLYASKPPNCYRSNDLFVGNVVDFENYKFELTGADEYTLRYMETHANEFSKSNVEVIMHSLRESIRPIYKEFVAKYFVGTTLPIVPYDTFRNSLKEVMGSNISEHEILTLARYFSPKLEAEKISLDVLQRVCHDELKKQLYVDFDKLWETFLHHDPTKCGQVSQSAAYTVFRGARVPLDPDFIKLILQRHGKGQASLVDYNELLTFLNYRKYPSIPTPPISIPGNMCWIKLQRPTYDKSDYVDIEKLISELKLEEDLKMGTL